MNIFLACDNNYYHQWAVNCINSIQKYCPEISITVLVVNPDNIKEIKGVRYFYENKKFKNADSEIAYYQAVRFLKAPEIFTNSELVLILDVDTICTKPVNMLDLKNIAKNICVLKHHKDDRWLAGFITLGNTSGFRDRYKELLLSKPIDDWKYGHDQDILKELANEFSFLPINVGTWMSFGKGDGVFLTLKGDQKVSPKYLPRYLEKVKDL